MTITPTGARPSRGAGHLLARIGFVLLALLSLSMGPATAGPSGTSAPVTEGDSGAADVIDVVATASDDGTFRFEVTIRSEETGWDYYADAFEVVAPDGTVLGIRTLHHPHVEEQPFTRSLTGVDVPDGIETVLVRAHHNPAGYDGQVMQVELPR